MVKILLVAILVISSFASLKTEAQCTFVIPSNVNVISEDSTIDCSFLVTQSFLVCPGATLFINGNSTCFNKFFLESGATIVFSDSIPSPYGSFSFYLKAGSTLEFNSSSPMSFGFIDTLVYEPGVTMIDTGQVFNDSTFCSTLIFDYSQLGGAPCAPSAINGLENFSFGISPNPFVDELKLNLQNSFAKKYEVVVYDLFGRKLEHFNLGSNSSYLKMKGEWTGIAIIDIRESDKVAGRKIIFRNNQ